MRYLSTIAAAVAVAAGCDSSRDVARSPACEAPLGVVAVMTDSVAAICLLPGFSKVGDSGGMWARGTVSDSGYAWLHLAVLDSARAAEEWGVPPVPRSFRQPDPPDFIHAVRTESVAVHAERIQGRLVEVETALVSGGVQGARRQPSLRAAWPIDGGRWMLVQSQATVPATLDSMRVMVRTVRVGPAGRGL